MVTTKTWGVGGGGTHKTQRTIRVQKAKERKYDTEKTFAKIIV